MLSINALSAECKKELPYHAPFPQQVKDAISCDVCTHALANLAIQVQAVREEKESKSLKLNEEDVLEIMDELCTPFTTRGEWIRRIVLKIPLSPTTTTNASSGIESRGYIDVLDFFAVCKRTCRSVEEACQALMDNEGMDHLSSIILANAKKFDNIADLKLVNKMAREICQPLDFCMAHMKYKEKLEHDLNKPTPDGSLLEQILSDKAEEITEDDLRLERTIYSSRDDAEEEPDIFSKEDMQKLVEAFKTRNPDMAKEVDPKAADLNKEEFEELHRVANEEHGDM
ncbi:unnamed protein product [Phytomonas sp. EM1]|nr:unnamed protein product [Phytomonas sp. EM1]|eukprot:CCW63313.1 unnamed protein product [Phytomonas sp. isolate EM1]